MNNLIQNSIYKQDIFTTLNSVVNLKKIRNQSVLITGASGLIGSFIVDTLHEANQMMKMGIKIYAMGRNLERLLKRFPYAIDSKDIFLVEHDVVYPFQPSCIKFDYIIHAAGNAYPQAMYTNPVGTIQANITGTYNLLELLKQTNGKRLLFVSSGEIYGQAEGSISAFDEEYQGKIDLLSVRSCYPLSKRTAENLCVSYAKQFQIEAVIVRPCHTYGATATHFDNRAHTQFLKKAIRHQDIILKSQGQQIRSYSYVGDTVSGLLTVLLEGKNREAYNLSNNTVYISIAELAKKIATLAHVKIHYELNDLQPSPFARAVLDSNKLERLGWKPAFDLEKGLLHTLMILRG